MKNEAIDIEGARALVSDEALWPLVRGFLWDFAPQVHPSWLAGESYPLESPRVRRMVLEKLGVEPVFCPFPRCDWCRLALLDGATLEAAAKWLGALMSADALRAVTAGPEVRALKAALSGVYPDVFSFTAYFAKFGASGAKPPAGGGAAGFVAGLGARLLESLLDGRPEALRRRFTLKLPREAAEAAGSAPVSDAALPADAPQFVSKLLKLKFPEAYTLCCS